MNRRDGAVSLALVGALVLIVAIIAVPSLGPAATPSPTPTTAPPTGHVQGVLGRPSSITPLTARTQVDRDLVALLFRGLVRLGPGTSIQPDLAQRWVVEKKGARWTFHLRQDATWHDGTPVTSADVLYTIGVLQHPDYDGPLKATWAQVAATALDEHTVQFDLGDPVGGFLQAASLPLLPAHLLQDVPVADLADSGFASEPIGNGSFTLVDLTSDGAVLEPVLPPVVTPSGPLGNPAAGPTEVRTPRLSSLELRFFDRAEDLQAAFEAGDVDSAADLPAAAAMGAAEAVAGARAIRYPGTTLTAVALNQSSPAGPFADERTRRSLVAAVDRADLVADLLGGAGAQAATPIPPSSWAYDGKAAPPIAYDRSAAAKGLRDAGWKRDADSKAWIAPGAKKPLELALLAPEPQANPVAFGAAERVAAAWTSLGLRTKVEPLAPGDFVERLRSGDYQAAIVDVSMGLDPDPYPILASTQVRTGGSNVIGIQDPELDLALVKARAPGSVASRTKAYRELQKLLGTKQPLPTLFFRDTVMVAGESLDGAAPRPVADGSDRFWDVIRWERSGR